MFNTLGNFDLDPTATLLFPDFATGPPCTCLAARPCDGPARAAPATTGTPAAESSSPRNA